jgi:predicted O-methyltransferase YrrM
MMEGYRLGNTPLNWHEDFIVELAKVLQPQIYVELGIYHCELFNRVIPYAGHLIGVDTWQEAGQLMLYSAKVRFIHATTVDFARELQDHPLMINLLFIDADHSRDAVLRDFYNFFPYVAPHGLILFHDTHPQPEHLQPGYCGTAYQAIEELARDTSGYEMATIPIAPGLTICRKRRRQLAWQ